MVGVTVSEVVDDPEEDVDVSEGVEGSEAGDTAGDTAGERPIGDDEGSAAKPAAESVDSETSGDSCSGGSTSANEDSTEVGLGIGGKYESVPTCACPNTA